MADPVWASLRAKRGKYKAYKAGGRVAGEKSKGRLDKMSRAADLSKDANGRSSEDEIMALGRSQREETTDWDYKKGGAIHIKEKNKGKLTKEVGKKGLKPSNLRKEIAHDKKEGNVAKEKREVFALNAKTKFKH